MITFSLRLFMASCGLIQLDETKTKKPSSKSRRQPTPSRSMAKTYSNRPSLSVNSEKPKSASKRKSNPTSNPVNQSGKRNKRANYAQ